MGAGSSGFIARRQHVVCELVRRRARRRRPISGLWALDDALKSTYMLLCATVAQPASNQIPCKVLAKPHDCSRRRRLSTKAQSLPHQSSIDMSAAAGAGARLAAGKSHMMQPPAAIEKRVQANIYQPGAVSLLPCVTAIACGVCVCGVCDELCCVVAVCTRLQCASCLQQAAAASLPPIQ